MVTTSQQRDIVSQRLNNILLTISNKIEAFNATDSGNMYDAPFPFSGIANR
ncbi:hypothetical protein ACR9GP_25340 [Enterobacter ludwigii]